MLLTKKIYFLPLILFTSLSKSQTMEHSSLFCYGDFYPETVKGYDYVIVEPSLFSKKDVSTLQLNNKHALAYISLGEVNEAASYYNDIKEETLSKNGVWNSHTIDLKAANTRNVLFDLVDSHLKTKGFSGLFLDNIDNYTKFGPTPDKIEELLSFLKEVKRRYPSSIIMQNAGLFIADETKPYINLIAVESVITDYDFENKKYRLRKKADFEKRLNHIKSIKHYNKIPIILIEYANNNILKRKVLKRLKKIKLSYFIGEIELKYPLKKKDK